MARRYDQFYRVKPRDNLGDPEYWNRRFEDIDRRVSSNEDGLDSIGGLTAYVEGLALNRLDLVLAPALDKITLVSEQGFLLAHSSSTVTLDVNTTQTFAIPDAAERELFAASPYVTITRQANMADYAFAQTVSYNKASGQLILRPIQIFGNAGPFNDWVIYVGTAISQTVSQMLSDTKSARDDAKSYRDSAVSNATQTASDKAAVTSMRTDALAARDAAAASAAAAALWDPSSYIAKQSAGTYTQTITFSMSPVVPTPAAGDNSTKVASTAFVAAAINSLINGAPGVLDTLKELSDALGGDANYSATITASLGNRVRFDAAQTLTGPQLTQVQANIGLTRVAAASEIWGNTTDNVVTVGKAWTATNFVNLGNVTGAVVINGNNGTRFYATLIGNVTISFTNFKNGQPADLILLQDATGGRTVSWSGVYFPDALVPQVTTSAGYIAVIFSGIFTPYGWMTGAGWKIY